MRFHQHGAHQPLGRGPGRADAADPFPPANLPGEPLAVVRGAELEADIREGGQDRPRGLHPGLSDRDRLGGLLLEVRGERRAQPVRPSPVRRLEHRPHGGGEGS